MSVIVNLAIFPTSEGESASPYVARALEVIRAAGLPFELHSMGTCIEGEWAEVMAVVDRCFQALEPDCSRIYVALTADYRKGASRRMESKVASVREKMGGS